MTAAISQVHQYVQDAKGVGAREGEAEGWKERCCIERLNFPFD